ncbi:zinc finger protein 385B-like [Nerophis lumbriciformis]|uniref:zinc finger protein 385B-like n=1 Tax=Nerophis lumbriciformis TaxID=546530 RepID=UPI002AE05588|nr:zinc finger protein 385B-like [Nerophis lumbriciformis]
MSSESSKTSPEVPLDPSMLAATTVREVKSNGTARKEDEDNDRKRLYCSLCKVAANSASQLQAHNSGTKHKTMLEARNGAGAIKSFPRPGVKVKASELWSDLQNRTFQCEICDVHVNSATQLKQHISSRRHKGRAAGKAAKPKFKPYTPGQRNTRILTLRWTREKNHERIKHTNSTSSLPTFHLHPATDSSPALFQALPLLQPLMRPSPAPVCATPLPFPHY